MYKTAKIAARAAATLRDSRWPAVMSRDAEQDGLFVFAVATTGIYCRPSCTSRRPRPENVRFFQSCKEAELAGFRPCRRCRPDQPQQQAVHTERVAQACRLIESRKAPYTLEELASAVGLSRFYFHQLFKNYTGMTPRAYGIVHGGRMANSPPVVEQANASQETQWFSSSAGRARQMQVRYTFGLCALGDLLVARSERGICAIFFGDSVDELRNSLLERFPSAEQAEDPELQQSLQRVQALISDPLQRLDLPLDVRGTVFQQRVWRALQQVPAGTLVSYAQIAERIGKLGSVRAVANACGANLCAVAIPCHRVVRSDGALSGYRWGVERKRWLIEREAQLKAARQGDVS